MKNRAEWRQGWRTRLGFPAIVLLAAMAPAPASALSERIVHNAYTGLAIDGYDPVAYFIAGKPLLGRREQELFFANVFWQFENEGNRKAFSDRPDVYLPAFGGYSAMSVAEGVPVPGDPLYFVVHQGRLYLFADDAQRKSWLDNPAEFIDVAERKWPNIRSTLAP